LRDLHNGERWVSEEVHQLFDLSDETGPCRGKLMPTISLRRLSDKTLAKYEQFEKEGKLTKRQANALWGHRNLTKYAEAADLAVNAEIKERRSWDE
jgi:SAM-dependent MidA family methyltransferase